MGERFGGDGAGGAVISAFIESKPVAIRLVAVKARCVLALLCSVGPVFRLELLERYTSSLSWSAVSPVLVRIRPVRRLRTVCHRCLRVWYLGAKLLEHGFEWKLGTGSEL